MPRGKVYTDRLPGRFEGLPWPSVEGAKRYNVCSSSNQLIGGHPARQLSPFFVGPIHLALPPVDGSGEAEVDVTCIENYWQASKVWPGELATDDKEAALRHWLHGSPREVDTREGLPSAAWFERRRKYWADPEPHRRIKRGTKKNNDDPLHCWWLGKAYPYVEARCRMYIPMYADLVARTPAYRALKAEVDAGQDVLLIGYDGYPTPKPLVEYLRDPAVRFGHELVLAAMLRDEAPWEALYPDIERVWEVPESLVPNIRRKKRAGDGDGRKSKKKKQIC